MTPSRLGRPTLNIYIMNKTLILLCVVLSGLGVSITQGQNKPNRPNIVWIFVEDMNGWYGCYGDKTVPTPHIDALAARGVRFDRAYMPAGVCSATRSAIATGAMQTSLGIHNHRSSRKRVPGEVTNLPDGAKTVYEVMRDNGYYVTSSKGKSDFNFIFKTTGLYDQLAGSMGLSDQHWSGRKDKPFFAQIQLKGGKNTGQFAGAIGKASAKKGKGKNKKKTTAGTIPRTDPSKMKVAPYYPDVSIMRQEYAHHYDTIRQTDDEVGQIIAKLKADGLLENTIVFFWTDHGMRLPRHKQWLYEGGIRVPLVVAGPGFKTGVRADLVSGIDITVATLALAGVAKPTWMEGQNFLGANHKPREFVVSARDRCDYTIERVRAITTKKYKYLRNFLTDRPFMQPHYRDGRPYIEVPRQLFKEGKLNAAQAFMWSPKRVAEELYDLEADPHEIKNMVADPAHAGALAQHRKILADWIKKTDDKGQYPESVASLRGVLTRWSKQAVNPEYEKARQKK
jgi:N-sulfoglucosamine sulfohydrolase